MKKQIVGVLLAVALAPMTSAEVPRTADGKPDLSATYDVGTLTPFERPVALGERQYITREEAAKVVAEAKALISDSDANLEPDRAAPPKGGDGNYAFGAGGVGGYNAFWIDRGEEVFEVDGKIRTSILYDPANGRYPAMTSQGQARMAKLYASYTKPNTGTAWWMAEEGPGPYDGPEARSPSDRCLGSFGSSGGPPMLPTLYNNFKRIVQTQDHVMILAEMVHDARIVRLNSEHVAPDIRKWMGDSIGWWEGDTLIVDTTNFNDTPGFTRATRNLHVVERFKRVDENLLMYSFTIDDPTVWEQPFSGEYPWPVSQQPVYEYACHEANYAMEGILSGARLLESEWKEEKGPGQKD